MDEVAKKIADFCVKNELVEQGMFEWCVYSIEKKLVTFSTWVVLISIGTRLFGFRCTLCFTLGFLVLRRRTNGYHAKTYIKCLIVSLLIECGSIFVVQNISMERLVFIIIFSNLTIFKFAPVNNEQIHLTVDEMNAMNYVSEQFPKLLEKNGLRPIRFHDLRHSCASLLLANGVPMKQIQEWLGHSDFSTTANIYAHLDYASKLSSAQAMLEGLGYGNASA